MRQKIGLLLVLPALCFLLLAASLYLARDRLTILPWPYFLPGGSDISHNEPDKASNKGLSTPLPSSTSIIVSPACCAAPSSTPTVTHESIIPTELINQYVEVILDPEATGLPRLECPPLNISRYKDLRLDRSTTPEIHYFFALDLRECLPLLPRLIGSIVEAIRFLEPQRCALSIVEGNSPDGTGDVLAALRPSLDGLNVTYYYQSSDVNPAAGERIKHLARLRNMALQPLFDHPERASDSSTVLFINDVAACVDDLLELALQRRTLGADMTCAMDWTSVGPDPTFYDVWVARGLNGDSFFEIGPDGSRDSAWNLFWNEPGSKARLDDHLPFQVFSCWNGAVALGARPLLDGLRFRDVSADAGECYQGEPQLFCKDLWFRGYGKIAVVPRVNLEYSDERALDIKRLKGYTSDLVRRQTEGENRVDWVREPPEQVKCMPQWENQFWRPWNETLGV